MIHIPINYFVIITFSFLTTPYLYATENFCPNGSNPNPQVIWCEGFENSDLGPNGTIAEKYFDFDDDQGDMIRTNVEKVDGQYSLRSRWQATEVEAGSFQIHFGRNPIGSSTNSTINYREIYWRFYFKLQSNFLDYPSKLTRLIGFANSNWAESMAAHVWADDTDRFFLVIDPASGINNQNQLVTTQWNDFANLTWLGSEKSITRIQPGQWYCIEAHVKLNDPNLSNGEFQLWINDVLQASITNINWVGTWSDYGLNAIMFSNYWGNGSPQLQDRYLDSIVISTSKIQCSNKTLLPNPPILID